MCGLAGIAVVGGGMLRAEHETLLSRMAHAVAHRGPDGERLYRDGPVGLGFRRLALVGPSSGDQPLLSAGGDVALIANGEVYNHRDLERGFGSGLTLSTKSDCEILAHLYARDGLDFLDQVNGMFSLAVWDRRRNRIVLARDRFGIKPLFYTRAGDTLLFGSEIKALLQHPDCPRELDWAGTLADQSMNFTPYFTEEPITAWFRGIEVVPSGTIVTIDLATGAVSSRKYWDLPDFDGDTELTDDEFVRTYRELLAESVTACATADAELGLFLSGGVDSAAVAALAARGGSEIHTFTVLSGGTIASGDAEASHRVATALGMPNHQVSFDVDSVPGVDQWKRLLWLLETPLCGPEQYYKYELYRYAKHVRPDLRGMLLGASSDEYNGGFSTVMCTSRDWQGFEDGIRQMARTTAQLRRPGLRPWSDLKGGSLVADDVLADDGYSSDAYPAYVRWRHRAMQQYNCWHEDRTAAGNGVEARVPFLDHRIVELLGRVPAKRRAGLLWDKAILRDGVRDLLPPEIAQRPKVPFFYGEGVGWTHRAFVRMLDQDGQALLEEALASPGAQRMLRPDAARGLLDRLRREPEPWDVEYLLRVVNLGLLDAMARELPAAVVDQPRDEVRPAVSIADWDRDRPDLSSSPAEPDPGRVLVLGEDVELMYGASDPTQLYVAVGGSLEYVIDTEVDRPWFEFLSAVDGRRTLSELYSVCGHTYEDVRNPLTESLASGVLVGATGDE